MTGAVLTMDRGEGPVGRIVAVAVAGSLAVGLVGFAPSTVRGLGEQVTCRVGSLLSGGGCATTLADDGRPAETNLALSPGGDRQVAQPESRSDAATPHPPSDDVSGPPVVMAPSSTGDVVFVYGSDGQPLHDEDGRPIVLDGATGRPLDQDGNPMRDDAVALVDDRWLVRIAQGAKAIIEAAGIGLGTWLLQNGDQSADIPGILTEEELPDVWREGLPGSLRTTDGATIVPVPGGLPLIVSPDDSAGIDALAQSDPNNLTTADGDGNLDPQGRPPMPYDRVEGAYVLEADGGLRLDTDVTSDMSDYEFAQLMQSEVGQEAIMRGLSSYVVETDGDVVAAVELMADDFEAAGDLIRQNTDSIGYVYAARATGSDPLGAREGEDFYREVDPETYDQVISELIDETPGEDQQTETSDGGGTGNNGGRGRITNPPGDNGKPWWRDNRFLISSAVILATSVPPSVIARISWVNNQVNHNQARNDTALPLVIQLSQEASSSLGITVPDRYVVEVGDHRWRAYEVEPGQSPPDSAIGGDLAGRQMSLREMITEYRKRKAPDWFILEQYQQSPEWESFESENGF